MGGHYNKAKTVSENLRLSGPLLSRFDLVFILLDKPDEEMDALLSEHVMAMHTGKSHGGMEDSRPDNSTVKGFSFLYNGRSKGDMVMHTASPQHVRILCTVCIQSYLCGKCECESHLHTSQSGTSFRFW